MPEAKFPCWECKEKYDRCHASCQKYIDEKKKREEKAAPARKASVARHKVSELRTKTYLVNKRKYHL